MYKSYDDLPDDCIKELIAQYSYDYFFHYLLIQSDSMRTMFCQYLTGDNSISHTTIENSESYSSQYKGKKLVMDVVAKDEQGRYYNFEMQMGDIYEDDEIRFASYLNRLIERQEKKGKNYRDIKDVYQLIIYLGRPMKKFKHYEHKIRRGDFQNMVPLNVERTHTTIIQIQNMEEDINMEARLTPFHQLMYLIGNNRVHEYSEISDIVKEAMEIHENYMKYDEVIRGYELERERMLQSSREDRARDDGIAIGKELGTLETMQQNIIELIQLIYGDVDTSFVYTCTKEQLQRGFPLAKEKLSYQMFQSKMMENKRTSI